jgi:hypothetical protein
VTIRLDPFADLNLVVGTRFPEADEDALWRCAAAWSAAATELRRLGPEAIVAGTRALDALGGEPGEAFAQLWQRFSADGDGFVDQVARACEELAAACDETACHVEYAKIQYLVALVILAATLAYLAALVVAGGFSAVGIPIAIAAAQFTIRALLLRLVSAVAFGVVLNVSLDGVAQGIQIGLDHRDGWDWRLTRRAAEDGAVYGAVTGGIFFGAGRLGLTNVGSAGAAAGLTGTVGGVAAPLLHGETPTWNDVLASTTSALLGGVGRRPGPGEVPISHLDVPDLGPLIGGPEALGSLDPHSMDESRPPGPRPDADPPVVEPRPDGPPSPGHRPAPEPTPDLGPTLAGDPPAGPPVPGRADLLASPPPAVRPVAPADPGSPTPLIAGAPVPGVPVSGMTAPGVTAPGVTAPGVTAPGTPTTGPTVPPGGPPAPSPGQPTPSGLAAASPGVLNPSTAPSPVTPPAHAAPHGETGPPASPDGIGAAGAAAPAVGRPPQSVDPGSPGRPGDDGTAHGPAHALSVDGAVGLARQHAFTTNAGLAFYPEGDPIRSFAQAVHPTDGFVTLDLHGSLQGFQIDNRLLTPEQVATALRTLEADGVISLGDGVGIKLLSCDTAVGGLNSVASRLARALGVDVIAPDTAVWTTPDGTEIVASAVLDNGIWIPTRPPDGAWHHFDPHGTETMLDDLPVAEQTDAETRSRSHGETAQPRAPDDPADPEREGGLFSNRYPQDLAWELSEAEALGVEITMPGTPAFDSAIDSGKVKWAVLADGRLVVMSLEIDGVEIYHSVLSGGEPVQAAGEALIAGSVAAGYFGLMIDNYSGHFRPTDDSVRIGRTAFERSGVTFPNDELRLAGTDGSS